jgi:hypothetical protein
MIDLKVNVLSSARNGEQFRCEIAPADEELRKNHPELTCMTEPFKTQAKIPRKPMRHDTADSDRASQAKIPRIAWLQSPMGAASQMPDMQQQQQQQQYMPQPGPGVAAGSGSAPGQWRSAPANFDLQALLDQRESELAVLREAQKVALARLAEADRVNTELRRHNEELERQTGDLERINSELQADNSELQAAGAQEQAEPSENA